MSTRCQLEALYILGDIMTIVNTKTQFGNASLSSTINGNYFRIKCPDCDKRRSGPCRHPSIPNLKGNTK